MYIPREKFEENGLYYEWQLVPDVNGGYPLLYVSREEGLLYEICAECANKIKNNTRDDEPYLEGATVYFEGPDYPCDMCDLIVQSAYGDPDVDKYPPGEPTGQLIDGVEY